VTPIGHPLICCAPQLTRNPQKNLPNKRNIGKQDPYCLVSLNEEKQRTKADKRGGQHPEWDQELRFTLFEEIEDGFGRPADEGGSPPPLPPKNSKGPPSIAGGKFMKVACFADDARDPTQIGETAVDLTEVLTKGETDGAFTQVPALSSLTIRQNGLHSPPRTSTLEKCIWS
jgi:hypothetical protein